MVRLDVVAATVASPLHDPRRLSGYVGEFSSSARGIPNLGVITEPSSLGAGAAILFVATGGTEHILLETVRRSGLRYVLLVYHDHENSLPAVLESAPVLRGLAHVDVVKLDNLQRWVEPVVSASRAAGRLRGSRLLLIGDPSPWLVYSSRSEDALASRLGISVERAGLEELYAEYEGVAEDGLLRSEDLGRLLPRSSVPEGALRSCYRLYLAVGSLLSKRGAGAATVRCFDLIKDLGLAGCLAVSMLLDSGAVVGCEADLPSAATMMILKELTGRPPWMANVVGVGRGTVELAHCAIATSLTCRYTLTTHFESGLPTAVAGWVKEGGVATVAKYDPKRNLIRAALGEVLEGSPKHDARCRTQVTLRVPEEYPRKTLEDPLGAHVVVSFADAVRSIEVFGKMLGIETEVFA